MIDNRLMNTLDDITDELMELATGSISGFKLAYYEDERTDSIAAGGNMSYSVPAISGYSVVGCIVGTSTTYLMGYFTPTTASTTASTRRYTIRNLTTSTTVDSFTTKVVAIYKKTEE